MDYKTGTAPREEFEARALFQMKFYALVLWRTSRHAIPRLLQLIYLGNGEIMRYEPDEADLLATERKVKALWQAIERARESATGGRGRAGSATGAPTSPLPGVRRHPAAAPRAHPGTRPEPRGRGHPARQPGRAAARPAGHAGRARPGRAAPGQRAAATARRRPSGHAQRACSHVAAASLRPGRWAGAAGPPGREIFT